MTYHEFYAPFAHLPGRYEWCRIHSTTHGSFDCFIVIHGTTAEPVSVYLCSENGARFMVDRFPESETIVVGENDLRIEMVDDDDAIRVHGELVATGGPVREARMRFVAPADALPRATPYGGRGFAVWGSRWTCDGVDLELDAAVTGFVTRSDGAPDRELPARAGSRSETIDGETGVLTLGSYGRLRELGAESA